MLTLELDAAALSEVGRREQNEDHLCLHVPEDPSQLARKGALFVVADGLGGHQAGEVASELAARTVLEDYYATTSSDRVEAALRRAVQNANLRVHQAALNDPALRGMETTLVAVAIAGVSAYVAHVGDSRVYHWHHERLSLLTTDHSEAAELVRMRVLSRERARDHPGRSALTRTIGGQLIVRPDFVRVAIDTEDRFMLCSDGLWSVLPDERIEELLGTGSVADACSQLVTAALEAGSDDNVSAVVVRVLARPEVGPESSRGRWGWLPIRRNGRPS